MPPEPKARPLASASARVLASIARSTSPRSKPTCAISTTPASSRATSRMSLKMVRRFSAEDWITSAQQRYAEVIQSSAENLLTIFNDILDVARLEAGVVEMAQVGFDLGEVLRAIEAKTRADAEAKGLAFGSGGIDQPWPLLVGDPARLRQVLAHLAGNAVKFTDQGEVAIAVRRRPVEGERTWIRIEVIDTGPGIAPALRTALFEPFRQADGGTTRRHGGAGLGLAICRHAVRLMGGAIGVADHPEGGSIFWVELALPNAQAAVVEAA